MTTTEDPRTVTTTGVGRASTPPDTAVITLAVERTADTPSAALSACTASTNAVVAAVREHISGSSGVQTSDLSVHPSYDRHGDRPDGYAARSTLTIRTGNLDGAGSIATDALEAADDAGQIHGLSLIVDDTRAASDEARAAAFTDAKRKAEHYAALAGASLGQLLHVSEGGQTALPHRYEAVLLATSAASPPIEPGENQVTVVVTAVWALTA